jgi:hypothetical protein
MRHPEELLRLLREANPIPDARARYEGSEQARAVSLLVEERRHPMPVPSTQNSTLLPPPTRGSRFRPALAFAGAAAAIALALVVVVVFAIRGNEKNVAGENWAGPGPTTGIIKISVEDWTGVEGYRLLAVVWTEDFDPDDSSTGPLVGGAFWTMIDRDSFSGEDVVHPLAWPNPRSGVRSWGAEDYLWTETAQFEPGTYRIEFYANPGELKPYGSHLPAEPIERRCVVEVEVEAGETSTVVISSIPTEGPCSEVG